MLSLADAVWDGFLDILKGVCGAVVYIVQERQGTRCPVSACDGALHGLVRLGRGLRLGLRL
eukprot:5238376-Alexandrium_andersonii.AAC.1